MDEWTSFILRSIPWVPKNQQGGKAMRCMIKQHKPQRNPAHGVDQTQDPSNGSPPIDQPAYYNCRVTVDELHIWFQQRVELIDGAINDP